MSKVFEKLVSKRMVVAVNELKRTVFTKHKDEYTCAYGDESG